MLAWFFSRINEVYIYQTVSPVGVINSLRDFGTILSSFSRTINIKILEIHHTVRFEVIFAWYSKSLLFGMGIQAIFDDWKKSFPRQGLLAVIYNKFLRLQGKFIHTDNHNVFSKDHLTYLHSSFSLANNTPHGYQARLFFTVGILTSIIPSFLVSLSVSQFNKNFSNEAVVWKIQRTVGSFSRSSKTSQGGLKKIGGHRP